MGKAIEGFLLCRIVPADCRLVVAAVRAWIKVLLFSLGAHIAVDGFGVVLRVGGSMKMLVYCWLVALGFEGGGVEGGGASDVHGVGSFGREDERMRVGWVESFFHVLDVIMVMAGGRVKAIVALHLR